MINLYYLYTDTIIIESIQILDLEQILTTISFISEELETAIHIAIFAAIMAAIQVWAYYSLEEDKKERKELERRLREERGY